jgi:predicted transglutaminase-like cysteine proteinase
LIGALLAASGARLAISDDFSDSVEGARSAALAQAAQSRTPPPAPASPELPNRPAGFIGFCMNFPADCADSAPAFASASRLDDILKISEDVNAAFPYTADRARGYGVSPYRVMHTGDTGSCHDYAVTKLDRLLKAGVPAGAMALAWVNVLSDPNDEDTHMVLLVRIDDGSIEVLDSLQYLSGGNNASKLSDVTDYHWKMRQEWGRPMSWVPIPDTCEPENFWHPLRCRVNAK